MGRTTGSENNNKTQNISGRMQENPKSYMNWKESEMNEWGCSEDERWSQQPSWVPQKWLVIYLVSPENLTPQENSQCWEYEQIIRTVIIPVPRLIALLHQHDFRGFTGLHSCGSKPNSSEGWLMTISFMGVSSWSMLQNIMCLVCSLQPNSATLGREGVRGGGGSKVRSPWPSISHTLQMNGQALGKGGITYH